LKFAVSAIIIAVSALSASAVAVASAGAVAQGPAQNVVLERAREKPIKNTKKMERGAGDLPA